MKIEKSEIIPGLRIVTPDVFRDFRGEYVETFSAKRYDFDDGTGNKVVFVEDDISVSSKGVLRGLHGDPKTWKLVQCLFGEFFLVVADMRKDSLAYFKWQSFSLNDQNRMQVLIPAGCGNGHLCLSEKCIFSYKQSQLYDGGASQFTIKWDEPKLNIQWPIKNPILSQRDSSAKYLD